jgi:hypothetical protein
MMSRPEQTGDFMVLFIIRHPHLSSCGTDNTVPATVAKQNHRCNSQFTTPSNRVERWLCLILKQCDNSHNFTRGVARIGICSRDLRAKLILADFCYRCSSYLCTVNAVVWSFVRTANIQAGKKTEDKTGLLAVIEIDAGP